MGLEYALIIWLLSAISFVAGIYTALKLRS